MNTEKKTKLIDRLKVRLHGQYDEQYLSVVIDEAEEWILAYTGRSVLPADLYKTLSDLVIITLNREGTEGESARSEGGESYTFETAPKQIYDVLNRYRLIRVGGKVFEGTK